MKTHEIKFYIFLNGYYHVKSFGITNIYIHKGYISIYIKTELDFNKIKDSLKSLIIVLDNNFKIKVDDNFSVEISIAGIEILINIKDII